MEDMGLKNGWLQILAAKAGCVFSVISPILTLLASVIGRNFDTLLGGYGSPNGLRMGLKIDLLSILAERRSHPTHRYA
jgi:hypothetical protein